MNSPVELARRLAERDATLWPQGNVSATRLGWLDSPSELRQEIPNLTKWAAALHSDFDSTLLFGMGGSSLAPEVFRTAFSGPLEVLDTTHPDTVERVLKNGEANGFAIVASKSGTTIEPNSMSAAWQSRVPSSTRIGAITDPDTELDHTATKNDYAAVFRNRPDIGGRYSALSMFGMVPAAALGVDLDALLDFDDRNLEPGVKLGQELATHHAAGRDKVTILCPTSIPDFGLWVEQLFAESTGKQGVGLIPIAGETVGDANAYDADRVFLRIHCGNDTAPGAMSLDSSKLSIIDIEIASPSQLGELMFRLEVATAVVGAELAIDPFNEPDVAVAKAATNEILQHWQDPEPANSPSDIPQWLQSQIHPLDYVAWCGFLPVDPAIDTGLARIQAATRDRFRVATTRGFGPRYLHSTGQLHKGGPNTVVVVQLVAGASADKPTFDLDIPGQPFSFSRLITAQALGDLKTLKNRDRRVLRVDLGSNPLEALATIEKSLQ